MFNEDKLVKDHKFRAKIILHGIAFAFIIILIRLWYLQVVVGDKLHQYSIQNRLRKETIKPPRGMIFSRNNKVLVYNDLRFDAIVTPQYLRNKNESLNKLASILGMKRKTIDKVLRKNAGNARYRPIVIKKNISKQELAIIETESSKMPGISVRTFISRKYKEKEIGAHFLGYIGEISQSQLPKYRKRDKYNYKLGDFIGQAGIEETFDLLLRGKDGHQFMEVDARGRMKKYAKNNLLFSNIKNQPATPGNNIRLTVDRDMQQTAFEALEGKVGSAVAIDVNTGEILSMVSRPSFDPTQFSKGLSKSYWASIVNNKFNPLRDRTIQEHYSPGSTFKTITAIAALEEDIIQPEQIINCGGVFKLGRRPYHDWKINGHGKTNVVKSLRQSVDVYYYKIATMLDIDILADYAKRLGFGSKTGINLPRETLGLIPTKEWKKKQFNEEWQLGETLSCAIGQSYVLATPIQLATAYAAIANGGKLYRPKLVRDIFSNSGQVLQSFKPELVSTVKFSEETMKYIHQGLYEVVNVRKGTAWWSRGRGIRMAGKTGTSQVRSMNKKELFSKCKDMPYESRHHGIFVGFAPFDNPQVAVAVVVEHGCSGSGAAAPVAKEIITTYMKKYHNELYTKYAKEDLISFRKFIKAEKKKKEALEKKKEKEASEEASN